MIYIDKHFEKKYLIFLSLFSEMDKKQTIAVDLGNSFIKIGFFLTNTITAVKRVSWADFIESEALYSDLNQCKGIISSVLSPQQNEIVQKRFPNLLFLNNSTKLPLKLNYEPPEKLGKDRICNVVGAWFQNKHQNSLAIDIGTCIKFDFVSKDGIYQGGSISPGMNLRYKSLNDYTANLPLLNETGEIQLIGKSTKESIHSGVINGMNAEILGLITQYEQKYDTLTIFVTGGDSKHFDFATKNNIFANENLTLEGLYQIYLLNDQ
jgi:type III pantothenate kinase